MCCFLALLGTLGPRVAFIVWWLVNPSLFDRIFSTFFWPVIGVIFAPWTTLMYTLAWWGSTPQGNLAFWGYLIIVLGIVADVGTHGGGLWRGRKKVPGYA
jgi:hypothetical protein